MSDGEVLFAPSKRLSSIQPVTGTALIKKTRPSKKLNSFSDRNKVWWSLIGSFTVEEVLLRMLRELETLQLWTMTVSLTFMSAFALF